MKLIALTGGIGSGKSVIAHVLQVMGYKVYDCDSRAKTLMADDDQVRLQLIEAFGAETYLDDGTINRQHLSSAAFGNNDALERLNAIVHPATSRDLESWAKKQSEQGASIAFVETALLRTSGLNHVVDDVWHVVAPDAVRINRVMARSGLNAAQIKARMDAQVDEDSVADGEHVIINDNDAALLPQITNLLHQMIDGKNKRPNEFFINYV